MPLFRKKGPRPPARQFTRRPLRLSGDARAHHFIAMRAKSEGDYEKAINAALDSWDRFGLSWTVGDALWDGFAEWRKIDGFQRDQALELALELYRRARHELPADIAEAPLGIDRPGSTPIDPVNEWVSLFNMAEQFFDVLPPEDRQAWAGEFFDDYCGLPPERRLDRLFVLEHLHSKYGVGAPECIHEANRAYRPGGPPGAGY